LLPLELLEDRRMLATFHPLASAPDGSPQSLRAAIIAANAIGQDNTIILQGGNYKLTIPNSAGHENAAAQGDLNLTGANHTITIQGAGEFGSGHALATVIDGGGLDRVFQVGAGVTAVFNDLVIIDGVARDNGDAGALPGSEALGGGILNAGTTVLNRVDVLGCSADARASQDGILSPPPPPGTAGGNAVGGGIYNEGVLSLNQCFMGEDTATGGDGADGAPTADNTGTNGAGAVGGIAWGGGVYDVGTSLTIFQSAICDNTVNGGNGGIGGNTLLSAGNPGGNGGFAQGCGLATFNDPKVRVIDSTIAANTVDGGAGGMGGSGGVSAGGVGQDGGLGGNGGIAAGGGIAFAYQPLNLYNSTVAANTVNCGSGGQGGSGTSGPNGSGAQGAAGVSPPSTAGSGGIAGGSGASLVSVSSLIAGNTGSYIASTGVIPASDVDAVFTVATNTLVGDGGGASGITNGVNGDIVGVDPMLTLLAANGGVTPTIALSRGSPAIDAGSNPLGLTTDQRGYGPRNVNRFTDIGAYEFGATVPKLVRITVKVVKVKGVREIEVFNAGTHKLRFAVYPFGKSYRGTFQVQERDVNGDGVQDVIVTRPNGHHKPITVIYSGLDGSELASNLE
jgi:hypothetical protein